VLGLLVGMGGLGALLGTFLAGRRHPFGRVLVVMILTNIVTLTFLLSNNHVHVVGVLAFSQVVGDSAAAIYGIYETSLMQRLVPDHLLGRANASVSFLTEGVMVLGALIAGVLGGIIGVRETLWLASFGFMVTSLWMLWSPVRKVDMMSIGEA
jgi:predicted MFS family arabinose efflux permease